jgi:hypothetical protein
VADAADPSVSALDEPWYSPSNPTGTPQYTQEQWSAMTVGQRFDAWFGGLSSTFNQTPEQAQALRSEGETQLGNQAAALVPSFTIPWWVYASAGLIAFVVVLHELNPTIGFLTAVRKA